MRSVVGISASLVAFVFLITVTSAGLRADDAAAAAQPLADGETGILVLQDGGVLAGQITRAADWYVVARGAGQMQVAQTRVLLVCRTLGEAYEFRRKQLSGDKAADHLRLAEWCIRYDLRDEAGRELVEARRLEPDQPRLALLERRLEKGVGRPVVKESVYLAAAKVGIKPQTDAVAPSGVKNVHDLPSGVVELFTRKVQPVLVNNCTTSGCHQAGVKQSFQLDRAILRGESNRRSTMRNLEAALALVDRDHPDQSRLLTVPRKSHGGTSGRIFGPRQEQAYKHLVDWVALIVPPVETAPVAGDVAANPADAKANGSPIQQVGHMEKKLADVSRPQPRRQFALHAEDAASDDSSMTLRAPHRLQVGAELKSWQPRDAFDPEIFNRGQRARGQGQANLSTAKTSTAAADATTAERR